MANLIVVTGPQAVGKMTVAEVLSNKINYSLMTNHDSIEVSLKVFGDNDSAWHDLNERIRTSVFDTAIKYNINLIFTFIIGFDLKEDIEYINHLKELFESSGGSFYIVELSADLDTRLKRNVSEHRLEMKKSKNDIEFSTNELLESNNNHRLNSNPDEYLCENHIKIDNSNLSPEEVADIVIDKFKLN